MSLPPVSAARARRAKFVPPQPSPWVVSRPRLTERLTDALLFPVTLVSAAAGSGKTTLLAEWARTLDLPWGWLTVDQADTTFGLLLTNLITAMQAAAPGVGESTLAQLHLASQPDLDLLVAELDDDLLSLDRDLVVVLDDAHLITDPRSIEFLDRFLQHPAPRLHLVAGVRRDLPLPLARLRGRGQLLEIRAAELAFTTGEARELLERAGVPAALAESLEQRNEGWAAGIHLGAFALRAQGADHRAVQAVTGIVQAGVYDLIVHDILALQTAPLQQLLLVSSLPERFTSDLCAALLDQRAQSAAIRPLLQELAADGLLLFSLGGDPEWFRYHQIFREVLRHELERRLSAAELAELHARASAWFGQAGMAAEAIAHALETGRQSEAITIVERHAQLAMAEDRWLELASWLEQLPPGTVSSRAELTIAQAWIFQARGQYAEMVAAVDRARVLIEDEAGAHEPAWRAALQADLATLLYMVQPIDQDSQGFVIIGEAAVADARDRYASGHGLYHLGLGLINQGDYPAVVRRMQQIIAEDRGSTDAFARQRELWARGFLGFVHFLAGDTARAFALEEETLGLATVYESPRFAALIRYLQGWLAYECNRLDEAIDQYERVVHERATGIIVLINSTLGLARALEAAGRSDEAKTLFQRLMERYEGAAPRLYGQPLVRAYDAERALEQGDFEAVANWLQGVGEWRARAAVNSNQYPFVVRVRALIALDRLGEAEAALQAMEATVTQQPMVHYQIRAQALRALLSFVSGEKHRAIEELRGAFQIAAPGGFVRGIFDLGYGSQAFRELLASMPAGDLPLTGQELNRYYHAGSSLWPAPPVATMEAFETPYEQLTEREQDVADGLVRRLSYKEIAYELNISPLTVKSHSTRIYSKLGVTSRRQMIRLLERRDA